MTKAEERKILEQIVNLIQSTPMDSYIRMAFSGVPEYAVRNIEDDAGYNPVDERNMWEKRCYDKDCELQKITADRDHWKHSFEACDENYKDLSAVVQKLRDERDAMADCVDGSNAIIDEAEAMIRKLKAEIVRMRMERMTEEDMAMLYDRMEGEFDD